jgi:lipopolysaccharide transport system ATP-binding protein
MSESAITVDKVAKRYRISRGEAAASSMGQAALRLALRPLAYLRESLRAPREDEVLWALRDVSFDVRPGEVLGVVGQNGSGKSTLLKVMARITAPTAGEVVIRGRVASLLEVGTGFHPELSGRENVYMNGAILGMSRAEIARNFDAIVQFAGEAVERLIDTPVKRYSSGMQVRLGFAVAAHLDPEVLLVDEVLSVGDAAFRDRCLGKMDAISKQGRTILLVSHNLESVTALCGRAVWLDRGELRAIGDAREVVRRYLAERHAGGRTGLGDKERAEQTTGRLRFTSLEAQDEGGAVVSAIPTGAHLRLVLDYEGDATRPLRAAHANIVVRNERGDELTRFWTPQQSFVFETLPARGRLVCTIPRLSLAPGRYTLDLDSSVEGELADWVKGAGTLEVVEGDYFKRGGTTFTAGVFLCDHAWSAAEGG